MVTTAQKTKKTSTNDEKMVVVKDLLKKKFKDGDEKLVDAFYEQLDDDHVAEYNKSESFRNELQEVLVSVIETRAKEAKQEETDLIEKRVKQIIPVMERIVKARKKTIIDYIALGKLIMLTKQIVESDKLDAALKKANIISKRQIQRYVNLVVHPHDLEKFSKLGASPSIAKYKEIRMDDRILELTEKSIEKFKHASMGKLAEIKMFTPSLKIMADYKEKYKRDTVFEIIINDGNDEVYDELEKASKGGASNDDTLLPTGITEEDIKRTMKAGTRSLAIDVCRLNAKNDELEKKLNGLADQMKAFRLQSGLQLVEATQEAAKEPAYG